MRFTVTSNAAQQLGVSMLEHVRTYGEDIETTYLEAALAYVTQQADRYFGACSLTLYLDKDEIELGVEYVFHKYFYPFYENPQDPQPFVLSYLNSSDEYTEFVEGTDYKFYYRRKPHQLKLLITELPQDANEDGDEFYRITYEFGSDVVPPQAIQATLLLAGHFYNQREAEVIGAITTEVKMGVDRLIGSIRDYSESPL